MLTMKTATTPQANTAAGESHAVRIIEGICCLAGSPTFLDDLRRTLRWAGMVRAIDQHDTPKVFDWLVETVSLQGISDGVARDYAELHGGITWVEIDASLAARPSCPKLPSYWQFWDCRYHKGDQDLRRARPPAGLPVAAASAAKRSAEPARLQPVPVHPGRDGRRPRRLARKQDRLRRSRQAVLEPLGCVYGLSDKVASMALSDLLLASGRPDWAEVGGSMVVFCTGRGSCGGWQPTIRSGRGATGQAAAPTSSSESPPIL